MPKANIVYTVLAQVNSFKELGFQTSMKINPYPPSYAPQILITKGSKSYRFCDPDWNVVISQLATLYGVFKNEKRIA